MKRTTLKMFGAGLLVAAAICLSAGMYLHIVPPQYGATVRFAAQTNLVASVDLQAQRGSENGFGGGPWRQSEIERIQSKMVLFQVISNLGLNRKWGEKFKEAELRTEVTYALLKRQIEARQDRNNAVIQIRVVSDDPGEAANLANAIASTYVAFRRPDQVNARNRSDVSAQEHLIANGPVADIIENAEPVPRPVKPSPAMKVAVPLAGLLLGVVGLVLFGLGFLRPPASIEHPPQLPPKGV